MTRRRGRDGDETPRVVRGAWTTPAVVVRRPDGSVVNPRSAGAGDGDPDRDRDGAPEPERGAGGRPRIRPRRIPGAPGAVLLVPTLSQAGDVAEGRRLRRNSGPPASVSPLPPRPPAPEPDDPAAGESPDGRAQPPLALVGEAFRRARGRGRDARGDGEAGPTARMVRTLRAVGPARLLPDDPEERAERLARLRRACVGAAAAVVACVMVYTVFPVRTALNLWEAEDRARERQAAFERENEILEDEIADLQSDERIDVEAREQGMVLPGEESYGIMPAPAPVPDSSTSTTVPSSTSTTTPRG